jgi:ATP/maltotriose-dependent transcriptional regulator MalT
VVIAGRADPALPLARMRARGELSEIRAAELRFTAEEAAAYLNEMMGLQLTARDVAALEGRTEGWIAALQLAALSMQGRDDVAGFIAGFAGDDRFVVDYLAEEVLARQSDRVQAFLLQTSILDRLSGPLCDAVTGQGGGKGLLEAFASVITTLFRADHQIAVLALGFLPVAAWEFSLGVWLVVKGFRPSAITAGMAAATTQAVHQDVAV